MISPDSIVGLVRCATYDGGAPAGAVDLLLDAVGFRLQPGSRVLLKPNLVAALSRDGLACTHPAVVVAIARWCLDHGAQVSVGDSPAFGSARGVMEACGMRQVLEGLPVQVREFRDTVPVRLPSGRTVAIAKAALECDCIVNLPKVKAHGQLYVTLGVKNLFGVVPGWRKPLLHMLLGGCSRSFAGVIADLPAVLPGGISLADGIIAMHRSGPIRGEPFPLHLLAASRDPVALDTALLAILTAVPERSPIAAECIRRRAAGTSLDALTFPLQQPGDLAVQNFVLPGELDPIRFSGARLLTGALKRYLNRLAGG